MDKLTKDELAYWGTEENFANHTHCDDDSGPMYTHKYVMQLTVRLWDSGEWKEAYKRSNERFIKAMVDKSDELATLRRQLAELVKLNNIQSDEIRRQSDRSYPPETEG